MGAPAPTLTFASMSFKARVSFLLCAIADTTCEGWCLVAGAYTRSQFSSTGALLSTVQPKLAHERVLELLKLSSNVNECKPLPGGRRLPGLGLRLATSSVLLAVQRPGAYTRPLFGSTYAHFVEYVGCMILPQSIKQGVTGRCDQNGLG